jgi:hypothetical protein
VGAVGAVIAPLVRVAAAGLPEGAVATDLGPHDAVTNTAEAIDNTVRNFLRDTSANPPSA